MNNAINNALPSPFIKQRPLWQTIAAIALLSSVTCAAGYAVFNMFFIPEKDKDELIVQSGIDSDFFKTRNDDPTPVADNPPVIENTPEVKTKVVYRTIKTPKKDIFDDEKAKRDLESDRIALINAARAKSSRTMAIASIDSKNGDQGLGFTYAEGHFDTETASASDSIYLNRVITADRMFGALLINEVISDLPGQITAQIEEDIYGFHGKEILIPRGSRAIGRYVPLGRIGDERLMATWDRVITPEGVNIHLRDAQLADTMGRTGGYGDVDRRLAERYGLSILLSTLTAAVGYQTNNNSANPNTAQTANTYTTSLADVTGQILREQINVMPRVTIPAGTRIFINPVHDIYFPPSSSGTVLAKLYIKETR